QRRSDRIQRGRLGLKAQLDPPARSGFKMLRILALLLVLLAVALTAWMDRYRSTRWREPLYVSLYPVAADDSAATSRYLMALDAARFRDIDLFFQREAFRHRLRLFEPVKMRLRGQLHE